MTKAARIFCQGATGSLLVMAVFFGESSLAQERPAADCGHGMLTAIGLAGAVVVAVGGGSPAEAAGVHAGDVIVGVDDTEAVNGMQVAVQVNPQTLKRKCGDTMALRIQSGGDTRVVKVTLSAYENPLARTPFVLAGIKNTAPNSFLARVLPEDWDSVKAEAARTKKPSGPVEIGSEYHPNAVSAGGGVSLAPSDGYTTVSLYTPRLALVDHLIRQRIAGQSAPSQDLLHAYAQANAFCVTARPVTLVAKVALLRGETTISASAVSEGFPLRFWFPLDAVRSGETFFIVVTDSSGAVCKFKVTPKILQRLHIR